MLKKPNLFAIYDPAMKIVIILVTEVRTAQRLNNCFE